MGRNNQILCLKNFDIETLGSYEEFLHEDGYRIVDLMAKKTTIQNLQIDQYDAIFIMGGPMSVNDNYDYLEQEQRIISTANKKQIPLMGVCLGSQLIASSCGGSVFKGEKKEIGWGDIVVTKKGTESLFANFHENNIKVFHWHGDTFTLPDEADILATSAAYIQAFKYKTSFGIQFHLEINQEMIRKWVVSYQKELDDEKISIDQFNLDNHQYFLNLKNTSKQVYYYFKKFFD